MILADVLRRSDRVALVEAGHAITYSELIEAAARRAERLPLESGECLALWAPNRIDWLVTLFACALRGILVAALNTRFRAAELGPLLGRRPGPGDRAGAALSGHRLPLDPA